MGIQSLISLRLVESVIPSRREVFFPSLLLHFSSARIRIPDPRFHARSLTLRMTPRFQRPLTEST